MIKQKEYAQRRKQLMRSSGEGAVIIVCAAPARIRNNDVHYPYRQDSDFLYLTGFREPEAVLVLMAEEEKAVLFCRPRDPEREMWDGAMAGLEGAVEHFGMDEAYDIADIGKNLPKMLHDRDRIFYDLGGDAAFDQRLIGWMHELRGTKRRNFHVPEEIHGLDHMLHDMRLYKSREELRVMRRSARVAIEAHERAMRHCRPGMNEAEVHAELVHAFVSNQCEPSYLPIVGGGANACVLHYIDNDQDLADGDLLLIDAGAEYDGYASDITRTFPVNGTFSAEQRELYDVVLAAQLEAIDHVRAGNQWDEVHDAAVRVVTRGLVDLGILEGDPNEIIEEEAYTRLYVHKTGHWLGLDVHDVGEYQIDGHSRELEPGMVLTVEPGVYIAASDETVDERWRGIGIRIEDDVAVTRDEPLVLSEGLVKNPDDIEALMAG
jgi:Xaa-Pro aminopeptidase